MSEFSVHEITTRDMFDSAVDVEWEAMQEPFRPEFPWLHPVHGHTEADRLASIQEDKDRRWQQHTSNPASHWLAVTENASGQVIGAAEWQIYTTNPFPDGPFKIECTWFPEGETREFVTDMVNQCYYTRMHWMDRPHISLNEMAVLPDWRRRGAGGLMMRWGLQKAEEFNLECYLEASDPGKDLYEQFDFRTLMTFAVNMHKKRPSQTWKRLQNEFPVIMCTCMWRPAPSDLRSKTNVSFWDILKQSGRT